MSHSDGAYLGGIRTIEDLRERCFCDPTSNCWHWRLCITQGAPKIHYRRPEDDSRTQSRGRRAALHLARGHDLRRGHVAYGVCNSFDCVNPGHCRSGTKTQAGAQLIKTGKLKGNISVSIASLKRWDKHGRKIDAAMAAEIRGSDESIRKLSDRLGVSTCAVRLCRNGETHRGPVSVFGWRKAA
jgi:hypothetical protein